MRRIGLLRFELQLTDSVRFAFHLRTKWVRLKADTTDRYLVRECEVRQLRNSVYTRLDSSRTLQCLRCS
jgi:hypothetical protein